MPAAWKWCSRNRSRLIADTLASTDRRPKESLRTVRFWRGADPGRAAAAALRLGPDDHGPRRARLARGGLADDCGGIRPRPAPRISACPDRLEAFDAAWHVAPVDPGL